MTTKIGAKITQFTIGFGFYVFTATAFTLFKIGVKTGQVLSFAAIIAAATAPMTLFVGAGVGLAYMIAVRKN